MECIYCITKVIFHIFVPQDAHGTPQVWSSMLQGPVRAQGLSKIHDDSSTLHGKVHGIEFHILEKASERITKTNGHCLNSHRYDSINDACQNATCWKHAPTICPTWTARCQLHWQLPCHQAATCLLKLEALLLGSYGIDNNAINPKTSPSHLLQ